MKFYKKLAAACLAAVMTLSFAGCSLSGTKWIARHGDREIPVGVYLTGMLQGYANIMSMAGGVDNELLKEKGQSGKTVSEMIQETAKENVTTAVALLAKADELGISLTEEELKEVEDTLEAVWKQQGTLYERNGIAKKSVLLLSQVSQLSDKIFSAIYGEGGELEVPADEIQARYQEKYAKAGLITVSKPQQSNVKDDATAEEKEMAEELYNTALASARSSANEWLIRAQAAESFETVVNDFKTAQGEEAEGSSIFGLVDLENDGVPSEIIVFLKNGEMKTPTLVETDKYFAIVYKVDPMEDPDDLKAMTNNILIDLKGSEFEDYIAKYAESLDIEYNQKAIDKYTPDIIKLG